MTLRMLLTAVLAGGLAASALPAAAQYIEKRSSTTYGAQSSTKPQPGPARSQATKSAKSATPRASQHGSSQSQTNATGQIQQRIQQRR